MKLYTIGDTGYPATPADIVAAIREGVETGTIEGEVVWLCSEHGRIGHRNACDGRARVEACPMVRSLVIPVDGGES